MAAIWEELLDVRPVSIRRSFFDLGGHSLLAIRMLAGLEKEFGRAPSIASLLAGASISEIARELRQPGSVVSQRPLVPMRSEGRGRPLFCVHPAGGIAYCFLELARAAGTLRPLYVFQAPGLEPGEEPVRSIVEQAAIYVEALRCVQQQGPYHLGGYSLGATVALEMAQQLVATGAEVSTLVVFDALAPVAPAHPRPEHLQLARQAVKLPLFGSSIGLRGDDDPSLEELAFILRSLQPSASGLRRLIDRLARLSPEQQVATALEFFGLRDVYHRERDPGPMHRLWSVLCTNLARLPVMSPLPSAGVSCSSARGPRSDTSRLWAGADLERR